LRHTNPNVMDATMIISLEKAKAKQKSAIESYLIDCLNYESCDLENLSLQELKGLVNDKNACARHNMAF